jgi:hypothetical protein
MLCQDLLKKGKNRRRKSILVDRWLVIYLFKDVPPSLSRGVTPGTALRLAKFFGVSPDFWMNIQLRWDLYFAKQSEADNLKTIKPLSVQP